MKYNRSEMDRAVAFLPVLSTVIKRDRAMCVSDSKHIMLEDY